MNCQFATWPVRIAAAPVFAFLISAGPLTPFAHILAAPPAEPQRELKAGVLQGMTYLEQKGLAWLREKKCASCHHVNMMVWAQKEARRRGLKIDEAGLKEGTQHLLAGDNRANILANPDVPGPGDENSARMGPLYAMFAFREIGVPPDQDPDKTLPRWTAYLRSKQQAGGFWLPHITRPPITPVDEESMTLTALYAVGASADADAESKRTQDDGRKWLAKNYKGASNQTYGLSILVGYEEKSAAAQLLERQNADGGWSQTKELASDAHATGHALYALLSRRSVGPEHPAAVKARDFLLKTQTPDGSWKMLSRPRADKEGTESAKNLEPITYASTAWAVLALLQFLPPTP